MIEVLFFARAAELAGTARGELSPPLPSTLGELQERVLAGHGGLAPLAGHLLWAVDEEVVRDPGHPLHDGATVAVMPPYSGGQAVAGDITLTDGALEGLVLGPADPEGRWGARVRFEGIVRRMEGDRPLRGIDYEAYASMASRVMGELVAEAEARWPGCACAVAHRTGEVAVGEASVVVEARSAHRAEAFEAARFLIDELKARVPIWKREHLLAAGGRPS